MWKKNEKQAIATAKEWTRKYAMVRFAYACVLVLVWVIILISAIFDLDALLT